MNGKGQQNLDSLLERVRSMGAETGENLVAFSGGNSTQQKCLAVPDSGGGGQLLAVDTREPVEPIWFLFLHEREMDVEFNGDAIGVDSREYFDGGSRRWNIRPGFAFGGVFEHGKDRSAPAQGRDSG